MNKSGKLTKQKKIDKYLGGLINFIIIFKKNLEKRHIEKKPKKIIIYKLDAIGDGILSLPMIKILKERTNAKIIVACSKNNKDVFLGHKFINSIVVFDSKGFNVLNIVKNIIELRKEKADIAIDTSQSANISAIFSYITSNFSIGFRKMKGKSRNKVYDFLINLDVEKHMIKNYFDLIRILGINIKKIPGLIKMNYGNKEKMKIKKLLRDKKKLIGIHPCSTLKYKVWPAERFARIIEFLTEKKYNIILVGAPEEKELVDGVLKKVDKKFYERIINLTGEINIRELAALMPNLKLFIANDGGPMHIAASMNIPVIGLFGHETPVRYAPRNKKSISLYRKKVCSPCNKAYADHWPSCKNNICLKSIEVIDVKKAIKSFLGNI